jgi:hypothetical protein
MRNVWRASERVFGLGVAALVLTAAPGCKEDDGGESGSGDASDGSEAGSGTPTTGAPGESSGSEGGEPAAVTWHQDLAPIVVGKCGSCHVAGGIGPFALQSYADAEPLGEALLDAVERKSMPPFLAETTAACQPRFEFQDDPRLTDEELEKLRAWIDQGKPEGDAKAAAPIDPPTDLTLKDADIHLQIPSEVTISGTNDQYLCFSVDPGFTEDTWLDGLQITAGNPKIVHHVLAYVDESGESAAMVGPNGEPYTCFGGPGINASGLIGVWAPGSLPFVPPKDVAMRVAAGSRIVLSVHYHPTGVEERDATTSLDLRTHFGFPKYVGLLALLGNEGSSGGGLQPGPNDPNGVPVFKIPANVDNHTEEMLVSLEGADIPELRVFGVATHMHYVGTDMLIGVQHNSPKEGVPDAECLLQTPRWDFQWQRLYSYATDLETVPRVYPGDDVYLKCTYNNTMGNPILARALSEQGLDEPQEVVLGEATLDEMCLGVFGVAVALEDVL